MIRFKIFSVNVKIDFSFFMFTALVFMMSNPQKIVLFAVSCAIHEMGHLTAMCVLGAESESVYISGLGIKIIQSRKVMINAERSLIILLCGPLLNLFLYLVSKDMFCSDFININLTLFMFNMLPFRNLDGGSILLYIGELFNMEIFFERLLKILAVITALIMVTAVYFLGGKVLMGAAVILYYCFTEIFT